MLRTLGARFEWTHLTKEERLVLLAISYQLQRVKGNNVNELDACVVSGLGTSDFRKTLETLERKDLVRSRDLGATSSKFLELSGDALSKSLLPKRMMPVLI